MWPQKANSLRIFTKSLMAILQMLEGKWVSSSKEIIAFRKSLLNPVISYQFQRFVSVKSDLLENDVLFWRECQKYKVKFIADYPITAIKLT